jgi:hypothetical protein
MNNPEFHVLYKGHLSRLAVFKERIILSVFGSSIMKFVFSSLPIHFINFYMRLLRLTWKRISGIHLNKRWEVEADFGIDTKTTLNPERKQ